MLRDNVVGSSKTMRERGNSSRAVPKPHRIERPPCLENPRPKGRNSTHQRKRCYGAVHADQDDGVCPDRSSRKRRNLPQVEQTSVVVLGVAEMNQRSALVIDHIEENVFYLCG